LCHTITIMAPSKDLPSAVVEHITALARGRCIPGSNRYAGVCRQWHEAGESSDEAQPLLQLYLDQRWVFPQDISQLSSWMSMHGYQVGTLVIEASLARAKQLKWFPGTATALCNLTRLEVAQRDSLALLAPVLGHLPQLQHLAAHVGLTVRPWIPSGKGLSFKVLASYTFSVGTSCWEEVPDMQELCPQLQQLQLTLEPDRDDIGVDGDQLLQLLPLGLQQLTLINKGCERARSIWLQSINLEDHTALQRVALHDVAEGSSTDYTMYLLGLQQRTQLQLRLSVSTNDQSALLEPAPQLTDYQVPSITDMQQLQNALQLTRLVFTRGLAGASVDALAVLTGLRELDLGLCGSNLAAAVEQAAGMPALCSLSVRGDVDDLAASSSSLARCTQLTALGLLFPTGPAASEDADISDSADESEASEEADPSEEGEPGHEGDVPEDGHAGLVVSSLQELAGLRCLTVPAELLSWEAGAWLTSLTSLSRLCVGLPDFYPQQPWPPGRSHQRQRPDSEWLGQRSEAEARSLLQQVQAWPASLQCVVFWVAPVARKWRHTLVRPRCWQHSTGGPVSRQLKVWLELPGGAAQGWSRPFWPCPHLQGVWELRAPGLGD
jgi:hypothetical protein